MKVQVLYNGMLDTQGDAFEQAIIDGYKNIFWDKTSSFTSQILSCLGKTVIDVKKDFSGVYITTEDVPDELKNKIEAAFK